MNDYDDLFDAIEDVEDIDEFFPDALDSDPDTCYVEEDIFCDFGFGDDEGLCVKVRYGCHLEGCPHATTNW